jgi:hypothetical protein
MMSHDQFGTPIRLPALELPGNLSLEGWITIGRELGRQQDALNWQLGDWWSAFRPQWGDQAKLFEDENWSGPAYHTCRHAAATCVAFAFGRRRPNLTFSHHVELASAALTERQQDALLDWCEEPRATGGQRRSVRELREEKERRRPKLKSTPAFGALEPAKALAVTVMPAPPREEIRAVLLPIAAVPRHEPEVQQQLGDPDCAARAALELALAGIGSALKVAGISEDLRERLQQCLRILGRP